MPVGGGKKGMDGEFRVGGCKLLYLERNGNGVLLYSTELCVTGSLAEQQKLDKHCKLYFN